MTIQGGAYEKKERRWEMACYKKICKLVNTMEFGIINSRKGVME